MAGLDFNEQRPWIAPCVEGPNSGSEAGAFFPFIETYVMTDSDFPPSAKGEEPPAGPRRAGSIRLVFLVAVTVVGVAVGLMAMGRTQAQPYILLLLALLAMVGLFMLFALAAGIVRFSQKHDGRSIAAPIVDSAFDGIVVTDPGGNVVYANSAYCVMTGAQDAIDARPIERVFLGDPDVSEAVFRLLKAAREGKRLQEEVRIGGVTPDEGRWLRLRVRPLGEGRRDARFTVWSVADVTRDRERQENIFQELRHAIDYLDHAPAGFSPSIRRAM